MAERSLNELTKIWIDRRALDSTVAKRAFEFFPKEKIEIIDEEPYVDKRGTMSKSEYEISKKELFITPFEGHFFKRCPGSRPGLTCCNYFVLNLGQQCNMDCSYCYLQSFLNSRVMKVYSNVDKALMELRQMGETLKDQAMRIGTGEVIDSLSLDPFTLYSRELITFFKDYPKWKLEFKTKSSQVDQFLDVEHAGNVVVSFSVNPENIIEREEHGTASLAARLQAARKARDKGFQIAFHMDPMIWHPEWKESYAQMVNAITELFSPHDVPISSVGALRFQPEQRILMRDRFGMKSLVTSAEVFPSSDGKLRYDQSLREEMFRFIFERFKENNRSWNIFMCMETPETWIKAIGQLPQNRTELKQSFDHSVIRKFDKSKVSLSSGLEV